MSNAAEDDPELVALRRRAAAGPEESLTANVVTALEEACAELLELTTGELSTIEQLEAQAIVCHGVVPGDGQGAMEQCRRIAPV